MQENPATDQELLPGNSAEIKGLLRRLEDLGLGRSIVKRIETPPLSGDQQRLGVELESEIDFLYLGHILPANEQDSAHIIIQPDGRILYIEEDMTKTRDIYYNHFSKNGLADIAAVYKPDHFPNLAAFLNQWSQTLFIGRIYDSFNPDQTEMVLQKLSSSLVVARGQREKILQAKQKSERQVIGGLKNFLDNNN